MCKIEEKYGYLIKWLKIKKLDRSFLFLKKKKKKEKKEKKKKKI